MFIYFAAATAQIKAKNILIVDKKEAVKNDIPLGHENNALYRYNKRYYNLHAHCILKTIKHKGKKLERDKQKKNSFCYLWSNLCQTMYPYK